MSTKQWWAAGAAALVVVVVVAVISHNLSVARAQDIQRAIEAVRMNQFPTKVRTSGF